MDIKSFSDYWKKPNGGTVESLDPPRMRNVSANAAFPYLGDLFPNATPPPLTVGTGTSSIGTGTNFPPNAVGGLWGNNLQISNNPFGALNDFFNIQYLSVEAVCAVTHQKLKSGEPVLILDEHIISKPAFMKLLRESFAKMMTPQIETMHEESDYDS